jgi:YacP-like NYN domain
VSVHAPVVLVDAENVRRSLWPNIPPAELVELTRAWARDAGVRSVVVFDGDAPAAEPDEHVATVATGAESADEWIAREAGRLRGSGEEFWLVTSDRALRAEAGAGAARTIGGGAFARQLRSA